MKRFFYGLAAVLLSAGIAAACPEFSHIRTFEPLSYEAIVVSNTAIGPTPANIIEASGAAADAVYGSFSIEDDSIRFRVDGTAPTATEGHLIDAGESFVVCGPATLQALQMIRVTSDADVKATYYRGLR